MIDDAFVFDCVAHVFNFDPKNAFGNAGLMFDNHLYAFHNALTPDDQPKLPQKEFLRQWTPSDIRKMVYEESDTDMLVAMPLPLTDLFRDGLSPWESCADLASRDPDRTIFWGSVNPLEGRKALDEMERQVGEFGARAFKFYNVRYDYGSPYPWRMDDPNIAFPVFEKARELGVNLIGVHKGVPLGPQPIEHTQTWDMDGAAANFPDINFVIFHVGLPFLDETCWQLIRSRTCTRRSRRRSTSWSGRRGCSRRSWASCSSGAARTRSSMARRRRCSTRSGRCARSWTSRSPRTCALATATRSSPTRPSARSSARTCFACTA